MLTAMNHALGLATSVIELATGGTGHTTSGTRSTLTDALKLALGVSSAIRGLGFDGLSWAGLRSRRSPLATAAFVGAGLAVGAGIGILFAPRSGASIRRTLLRSLEGMKREAQGEIEKVGDEVKEIEGQVEKKVGQVVGTVKSRVDAAADEVKATAKDVKKTVAEAKSSTFPTTSSFIEASRREVSGPPHAQSAKRGSSYD